MDLKDNVAIVTGASHGIGLATCKALLAEGVKVAGWSRSRPDIKEGNFHFYQVDITDEQAVKEAYEQLNNDLGEVSILINNAGQGYVGAIEEMETKDWEYLFDLNVHGLFYITKLIVPAMKKQQEGHIINIASGAGTNGIANMVAYCGTKHAVVGISHALHNELRNDGIKVTCLSPGSVATHFNEAMGKESSGKNAMMPEDIAASIVHALACPQNYHYVDMEVRPLQPNKGKA